MSISMTQSREQPLGAHSLHLYQKMKQEKMEKVRLLAHWSQEKICMFYLPCGKVDQKLSSSQESSIEILCLLFLSEFERS